MVNHHLKRLLVDHNKKRSWPELNRRPQDNPVLYRWATTVPCSTAELQLFSVSIPLVLNLYQFEKDRHQYGDRALRQRSTYKFRRLLVKNDHNEARQRPAGFIIRFWFLDVPSSMLAIKYAFLKMEKELSIFLLTPPVFFVIYSILLFILSSFLEIRTALAPWSTSSSQKPNPIPSVAHLTTAHWPWSSPYRETQELERISLTSSQQIIASTLRK